MREELSKVKNMIAVGCDTDMHGATLCAAATRALISLGVPPQEIAVISHFAVGDEMATTARGNVEAFLEELTKYTPKKLFLLDIPAKSTRFVELIAKLTKMGVSVTIIDDVSHWKDYLQYLWTLDFDPNKLVLRLSTSVTDNYLHFMAIKPSSKIYELAMLGVISENKFEELPKLDVLRSMVPQEQREQLPLPTISFVRRNFAAFVSVDTHLKFDKFDKNVATNITLIGNTAAKVVYLLETPLEKVIENALKKYPAPPELSYEIKEFVAVAKTEAPRGQGFKYASLVSSKVDVPFVISIAEGFESGKKVVIVAPNNFTDDGTAASIIRNNSKRLHEMLVAKGYSTNADYPRGDAAIAVGVFADRVQDAISLIVEELNAAYTRERVDEYAAKVANDIVKLVVLEESVASAFGVAVRESIAATVKHIKSMIREEVREVVREVIREELSRK